MNIQSVLNNYDLEYLISFDELNQEQKDYLSKKLEGFKDKNNYELFLISFLENPDIKMNGVDEK